MYLRCLASLDLRLLGRKMIASASGLSSVLSEVVTLRRFSSGSACSAFSWEGAEAVRATDEAVLLDHRVQRNALLGLGHHPLPRRLLQIGQRERDAALKRRACSAYAGLHFRETHAQELCR